eukprot:CAMPEP_0174916968 /NCGR_PEP_ID=MMETSP1355-20121228/2180_1 /TAXON_ID=464990 /ORGANISM="Hemiselmis tepida, Strain CCMP443" /LENGTH=35 /DNA_ID= /DNA_START= /DNA_END= /DNA_ORIENTATION=
MSHMLPRALPFSRAMSLWSPPPGATSTCLILRRLA